MRRVEFRLPKLGLVMESARVVRWLRSTGDEVRAGEPLLELETEKSIVEVEAPVAGRLLEIACAAESNALVGDLLGWIGTTEATAAVATPSDPMPAVPAQPDAPAAPAAPAADPIASASQPHPGRLRSSPAARRLAADRGVDLSTLRGSGPGGRIQMSDVAAAQDAPAAATAGLSPMRRAVARAMTLSAGTIPQFSLERTVDLSAVLSSRARFPTGPARPSVTDYLIAAIGRTLVDFPAANAVFIGRPDDEDARIERSDGVNVSLVVAVPDGLRLATLHHVETLSLLQIARQRSAAVERAREGRLQREDLATGSFGLSNLGPSGPDRFNAMLSPGQSAILAVGREHDALWMRDGSVAARRVIQLTLTVDHRVIDGRLAADFLAALANCLEQVGPDDRRE